MTVYLNDHPCIRCSDSKILLDYMVSRGFAVERFRCPGCFAVNLDDSR